MNLQKFYSNLRRDFHVPDVTVDKKTLPQKMAGTFCKKVEILPRFLYFTDCHADCQEIFAVRQSGKKLLHTSSANNMDFKISMDLF